MGITGAELATIYDDQTDEYIQIRLIGQDSDFNIDGIGEEDIEGNELWIEDQAALILVFFDDADISKLKSWQKNRRKLKARINGIEDYIFWDQPSTIIIKEPKDFRPRRKNKRRLVMRAKGPNLPIERTTPIELVDEDGAELMGFIGKNETGDGIEAHVLPPATFGAAGSVSWTIGGKTYNMNTITFNTLN